jgi:hypothetical protein
MSEKHDSDIEDVERRNSLLEGSSERQDDSAEERSDEEPHSHRLDDKNQALDETGPSPSDGDAKDVHDDGKGLDGADAAQDAAVEDQVSMEDNIDKMSSADLRKLIERMRKEHEEQLHAEERARAEVEDMCLRIEKHFKAEKVPVATASPHVFFYVELYAGPWSCYSCYFFILGVTILNSQIESQHI